MATEDRELKEIIYHENMGDDEHSRNSKMKCLYRGTKFSKETEMECSYVYEKILESGVLYS